MGVGVRPKARRWLGKEIPFAIHSSYPAGKIASVIHRALHHWESETLYRFVPRAGEEDYIEFRQEGHT